MPRPFLSRLRIFAPPEHAVLSLEVQARMAPTEPEERSQFGVLVRLFLDRFFNNEMVSADHEARTRLIQIACAIGLPGLFLAMYLFPPYHFPGGRPFWYQVRDQYFYVMYSWVAMGIVTIFEWDSFFPDLLDIFVLASLPIQNRKLFLARITAVSIFIGVFLLGTNFLGVIFLPAASDLPSLARHFAAHLLAVSASGLFAAALFLALPGLVLTILGKHLVRWFLPVLQGLSTVMVATVFFLFPVLSRFLPALMNSSSQAVRYFPPFWFLGIYERLLRGPSTLPIFTTLARTGCLATLCAMALAVFVYPFAYHRKTRQLIEGSATRGTQNRTFRSIRRLLHATVLRHPVRRAVYHFISQTLPRTQRHRTYLAMYGGAGVALILASAVGLKLGHSHIRIALSPEGLEAAIPIVAFWTIAGLRTAFVSPADQRGSWIFRVIRGRPGLDQLMAAKLWVLLWSMALTLATVAALHIAAPAAFGGWRTGAAQTLAAAALCLLLTDAFFLKVKIIPFTGALVPSRTNLVFGIVLYFGLFPPLVLVTLGCASWMEESAGHLVLAVLATALAHGAMEMLHRKIVAEHVRLLDVDEEEEEFPQRLGLRY